MHRTSACCGIRDTSTRRDHGTSTSDRVIRAGASCVLRGVSTCWVRCASASGRVHRVSAGRDCDASTLDQAHHASTCCVIRGARCSWVSCASASGRVYRASTSQVIHDAAPAPAVSCVASAPAVYAVPHPWSSTSHQRLPCLCGASTGCVRCASASGQVHRASACCDRDTYASGRVHRAVSTAPVAEPMSFTVPLTGSTIVVVAMRVGRLH